MLAQGVMWVSDPQDCISIRCEKIFLCAVSLFFLDLNPYVITSGRIFGPEESLPIPMQPDSNALAITPICLVDMDFGNCLQFPQQKNVQNLLLKLENIPSSSLRIHGQDLDCMNILVGMHMQNVQPANICTLQEFIPCLIQEDGDGVCHSECNIGDGWKGVIIHLRSISRLTELESVNTMRRLNSTLAPPFSIDHYWDEFLQFINQE